MKPRLVPHACAGGRYWTARPPAGVALPDGLRCAAGVTPEEAYLRLFRVLWLAKPQA